MSWLFSQALVEEYLVDTSSDGEQSVQSNGKPTQQAYCAPDKMTDFSCLSRFGMTYKPLTETRGEELLTLYLAAFHAKTSLPLGGGGIDGERSGMWREMARIICEVRPGFVFVENSPMLTSRGLGRVLGDLASMGFDARWGVLGAANVGANHQRDRIWIVGKKLANSNSISSKIRRDDSANEKNGGFRNNNIGRSGGNDWRQFNSQKDAELADTKNSRYVWWDRFMGTTEQEYNKRRSQIDGCGEWWKAEPDVGRVADGVASRVDRLKAIGNGQVPLCAATAWRILSESL
jgi:DNA (cytosine-5)-methyltransferase 1